MVVAQSEDCFLMCLSTLQMTNYQYIGLEGRIIYCGCFLSKIYCVSE